MSNEELLQELRRTQEKVKELERILKQRVEPAQTKTESEEPDLLQRVSRIEEQMKVGERGGILDSWVENITIGGLIEIGAVYADTDNRGGGSTKDSDISLTTVELGIGIEVNEWVEGEVVLLYEDATFGDESSLDVDVGTVTIGNTECFLVYGTGGKMYVPFGALLTHFPDDPLIDQPLTLAFGETSEKAVLLGVEKNGFAASVYSFNGDLDKAGKDNRIESYGFDANYTFEEEDFGLFFGASYISNVADSDGLTDGLDADELDEYVAGAAAYCHLEMSGFFLDGEYMTALRSFNREELATGNGSGARPSVWNIEGGYNWNWGKNLQIALKYAGSRESEGLGFPKRRYGINFNQEIFAGVTGSIGYIHDRFERGDVDGRDDRDLFFTQLAIEF